MFWRLTDCRIPEYPAAMPNYDEPLLRVLRQVGGPSSLASSLKIVPSAVTQWERIPPRHVGPIEALTGIPAHELRPDLFQPRGEA